MEPEGPLLHSQVPATCPYPEPSRSSPHPHIPLPVLLFRSCQIISKLSCFVTNPVVMVRSC